MKVNRQQVGKAMKHIDLFNIKLNQIRIFLSVVEYGGFTAAAEKLHMTQPMISKTVSHLEEELGLYLIVRNSHKFQVTPSGLKLYETWKGLMQGFEDSLVSAHSIQSGKNDKLKIGTGELDPYDNPIIKNLQKMKQILPGVDVFGESREMSVLVAELVKDNLDMIIISKHMIPMLSKLNVEWKAIIPSQLCIYVHRSNPLFERKYLDFSNLKKEKFIVFSPKNDDSYMELLKHLAKKADFVPQISCYIQSETSFKINLELGNGVALLDSYTNLESENIKKFPLNIRNDIIAVWKSGKCRHCMKVFLELFETEA